MRPLPSRNADSVCALESCIHPAGANRERTRLRREEFFLGSLGAEEISMHGCLLCNVGICFGEPMQKREVSKDLLLDLTCLLNST